MEPQRYKGVKLFCFRSDFFFFLESSSGSRQKGACCHQTKYLTESLNSQSNYFCSCSWRCCPLEWMFFAQKCNHWKMLWQEYLRTTILCLEAAVFGKSQWTMKIREILGRQIVTLKTLIFSNEQINGSLENLRFLLFFFFEMTWKMLCVCAHWCISTSWMNSASQLTPKLCATPPPSTYFIAFMYVVVYHLEQKPHHISQDERGDQIPVDNIPKASDTPKQGNRFKSLSIVIYMHAPLQVSKISKLILFTSQVPYNLSPFIIYLTLLERRFFFSMLSNGLCGCLQHILTNKNYQARPNSLISG